MIEKCLERWHQYVRGELPGGLDDLLADDVVFYSPIVFTPQEGKAVTKLYLQAATQTFDPGSEGAAKKPRKNGFRYSKEVFHGNCAILEFETEVAGKYVNGVDIITFGDDGRIVEFKVMIRPLQAVNLMHQQMAAMLKKMQES